MFNKLQFLAAPAALSLVLTVSPLAAAPDDDSTSFNMVVSAGAKPCLPNDLVRQLVSCLALDQTVAVRRSIKGPLA